MKPERNISRHTELQYRTNSQRTSIIGNRIRRVRLRYYFNFNFKWFRRMFYNNAYQYIALREDDRNTSTIYIDHKDSSILYKSKSKLEIKDHVLGQSL